MNKIENEEQSATEDETYDLIALGSSPAGLLAAIVAHDHGLKAVVLEATGKLGGGTARSNGGMWIPLTGLQKDMGLQDSREAVFSYIHATSLGRHVDGKLAAYLDYGDEALEYAHKHTPLRIAGSVEGDYYTQLAGSRAGRLLWPDLAAMEPIFADKERYPLLEKVLGPGAPMDVGAQDGTDSWGGGTALIGGLVAGCLDRGIPVLLNMRARHLLLSDGRVTGVQVESAAGVRTLAARKAVLIATGGYEFNRDMVKSFIPYPEQVFPMTAPGNQGDGHLMGMEIGAATALMDCGVWMVALLTPGEERWGIAPEGWMEGGSSFFCLPGQILVNQHGERVCDEGSYPSVPPAMFAHRTDKSSAYANLPLFVVFDQAARDKFGIGPLLPGDNRERSWLLQAETLEALAQKAGIDARSFGKAMERYNANAEKGVDPDFGRGARQFNPVIVKDLETAKKRGIFIREPRPYVAGSVAPIGTPPFYAARMGLATIGNRGGLVTDEKQRVLTWEKKPIPGLLAASNAAAQLAVGGGYSSGQSIGLSFVGGYIAGLTASERNN